MGSELVQQAAAHASDYRFLLLGSGNGFRVIYSQSYLMNYKTPD